MTPKTLILTGPVHSGKSTVLLHWCLWHGHTNEIHGLLNPSIKNRKIFMELPEFESFSAHPVEGETKLQYGEYVFSEKAFEQARSKLADAILSPSDVLVVDEIGKLELAGEGLAPEIDLLIRNRSTLKTKLLILLVRDYLLEEVVDRYNLQDAEVVTQRYFLTRKPPVAILIGGKSSRMGEAKHDLNYGFGNILHVLKDKFEPVSGSVVISHNGSQNVDVSPEECIIDTHGDSGPMGGILTVLEQLKTSSVMFLSCDLPFLSDSIYEQLLQVHNESVVATCAIKKGSDHPEPLVAIWNRSAIDGLQSAIETGNYSLLDFLKNHPIKKVEIEARQLTNVNTYAEYLEAKAQLEAQ